MDEVITALQKSYRPNKDNVRLKRIVKRKEDILVETDAVESLEKLSGDTEKVRDTGSNEE